METMAKASTLWPLFIFSFFVQMAKEKYTEQLIRSLERFMVRECKLQPDMVWIKDYSTLRSNIKLLSQYEFCPVFFEKMLGLMCERIQEGKDISLSVLKYTRAWLNKAKGFKAGPYQIIRIQDVDLKELFGSNYTCIADYLFLLFSTYIFERKRGELVKSLITNVELKPDHQLWIVDHWHKDDGILQKLLEYPFHSEIISTWVSKKGIYEGALLPKLSELVAHAISADTEFLLTIKQVKKLMSSVQVLWEALYIFYNEEIKGHLDDEPFNWDSVGNIENFEQRKHLSKSTEVNLLDCLEADLKIHPSFYHSVEYFAQLAVMRLRFRLYPNTFGTTHLKVGHYFEFPKSDWVAFELKPFDFTNDEFPKQTKYSVRNFFRVFPYIDIDATVEEWHTDAKRIRDVYFYTGIYKSMLPQQNKNELYKRYFSTELQFVLYDFIRWEKNTEMAGWLMARLAK